MEEALQSGYTADEINAHLAKKSAEAKREGYTEAEIEAYVKDRVFQKPDFNQTPLVSIGTRNLMPRDRPKTLKEAIVTGYEWSSLGLGQEMMKDDGRLPSLAIDSETPWYLRAAANLTGTVSDIPAMIAGGVIGGGPASPITAVGGAFAMPMGLRKVFVDSLEANEIGTRKEFADRVTGTMWETAKGWMTGAATAGVGKAATVATSSLPGAAKTILPTVAELATLTEVSARLEGHAPEPQALLDNAIVLGVAKAVLPSWTSAKPLTYTYVKTGIHPEQVVQGAIKDSRVWQDALDGRMPDAYKSHVEQPPSAQTQAQRIESFAKALGVPIEKTSGDPEFSRESGSIYITDMPDGEFIAKYGASKDDVTLHEIGHALLNKWQMTGEIKGPAYADLREELRNIRKDFKGGALEIADSKMRRHFNKSQELLADGLAVWIKHPEKRAAMPRFNELFSARLSDIKRALGGQELVQEQVSAKQESAQPAASTKPALREFRTPPLTPEQQIQARAFFDQPFAEIPQMPNEPSRPTHINYNYIQTTEEAAQALSQLSTIYESKIKDKQQSPRAWAQSQQDAAKVLGDLLQTSPEKAAAFLSGQQAGPSTTAQLLARKELALAFTEDLMRTRATLATKGDKMTTEDLASFLAQVERTSTVQATFLGQRADVGRALNALKSTQREAERSQKIIDAINAYGGEKNVKKLIDLLGEYDNPAQVVAFSRRATKATNWEMVVEAWKAGLVSGLRTNEINFLSTAAFSLLRLPIEAITAAYGAMSRAEDRVLFSEIPARAIGMVAGLRAGAKTAGAVLRSGVGEEAAGKLDQERQAIPGKVGELVRLPFRPLRASDALLRAVNEHGQAYADATKLAMQEGHPFGSQAFFGRIVDLVQNPTQEMIQSAKEAGERYTFNRPLGEKGKQFQRLVKMVGLEWMFPFITTPGNIFKETLRMTPGARWAVREWRDDYEAGGARKQRAMAEVTVGGILAALVMSAASDGTITGNGTPDKGVRKTERAAGWKPYAVKIGNEYYDGYLRMAPIGPLIGMAVDGYEFHKYMTGEERDQWGTMLAFAFAQNVTNQTFMTGMTNFVGVLQDPSRNGQNYFEMLASSLVPGILGQTAAELDPLQREMHSMRDAMIARVPGMREGLIPQRDLFGQPIQSPERLWFGSPFSVSAISDDKVRTEAARLGFATPDIPKKLDTLPGVKAGKLDYVELTPQQRDVFATMSGQLAYYVLKPIVTTADWDKQPPIVQRRVYEVVYKRSRDYAANQLLLGLDPSVTQHAIEEVREAYGQ